MLDQKEFTLVQILWSVLAAVGLLAFGFFTIETFVLVVFAGFLLSVALTATPPRPRWRRRLKWPIATGLIVFVLIVARRIATIV